MAALVRAAPPLAGRAPSRPDVVVVLAAIVLAWPNPRMRRLSVGADGEMTEGATFASYGSSPARPSGRPPAWISSRTHWTRRARSILTSNFRTASRTLGAIARQGRRSPKAKGEKRAARTLSRGELRNTSQLAPWRVITRTRALHNKQQVEMPQKVKTSKTRNVPRNTKSQKVKASRKVKKSKTQKVEKQKSSKESESAKTHEKSKSSEKNRNVPNRRKVKLFDF